MSAWLFTSSASPTLSHFVMIKKEAQALMKDLEKATAFKIQFGAGIAQLVVLGLAVHSVPGSILLWGHFR